MITRIYRVEINPELREEFETKFRQVADEFVDGREGLVSVSICKPTEWSPNEYVMVTIWKDVASVKQFAGETWGLPVIPDDMKRFTRQCWLHQFENWEQPE